MNFVAGEVAAGGARGEHGAARRVALVLAELPRGDPGHRGGHRAWGGRVRVGAEDGDAGRLPVEAVGVRAEDRPVHPALTALEDRPALVDQEVVADVLPAVAVDVVRVHAAHHRRGVGAGVVVRPRGVVDEDRLDRVQVLRGLRADRLVGAPARTRGDRRLGHGGGRRGRQGFGRGRTRGRRGARARRGCGRLRGGSGRGRRRGVGRRRLDGRLRAVARRGRLGRGRVRRIGGGCGRFVGRGDVGGESGRVRVHGAAPARVHGVQPQPRGQLRGDLAARVDPDLDTVGRAHPARFGAPPYAGPAGLRTPVDIGFERQPGRPVALGGGPGPHLHGSGDLGRGVGPGDAQHAERLGVLLAEDGGRAVTVHLQRGLVHGGLDGAGLGVGVHRGVARHPLEDQDTRHGGRGQGSRDPYSFLRSQVVPHGSCRTAASSGAACGDSTGS